MTGPKIAIVCPGVGLVQRGFERFFGDLFHTLRDDMDVVLYKGGGPTSDSERIIPFIARGGRFLKTLPIHRLVGRTPMHVECMTLALSLLAEIRREKYDVVHVIDPPLARILFTLRKLTGGSFRILYTEGTAMPVRDYPPCDHLQQISAATLEDAVAQGVPIEHMSLIPCGVDLERLGTAKTRSSLRAKYGLAEDKFVILSVAAINRGHKRTDHLIDEVARLEGNAILWLDGSLDHGDPELLDYGRARLGDRLVVTHVPTDDVAELYTLADLFVHTAGFEAFGLAIVEAAGLGLPVLVHDAPHFQWLVPNESCHLDMLAEGELSGRLQAIIDGRIDLATMKCAEHVRATYDWGRLKDQYRALYLDVSRRGASSEADLGLKCA